MLRPSQIARVALAHFAAFVEDLEVLELEERAEQRAWLDQGQSPLGARRHIRAVRARIARGGAGAARSGRRYLLSAEALAEELERPAMASSDALPAAPSVGDALRAELRLVGGQKTGTSRGQVARGSSNP